MKKFFLGLLSIGLFSAHGFAEGRQLSGQHAPANTPALAAEEAQKKFVVPEGFEVRLFAAEPEVVNPVAMTWDERGRLWVLELYEYPLGAPAGQKGRDRLKILEDTDGDGRADKVTVFADGLNLATGLLIGNGGVYVGQAPDLLFLQDTNHDDKADTREVVLTGFGLNDRHELLNGFTWGPDGWLYMTHGVFNSSKIKIPEGTTPGVQMTAAVARFHPRTKRFEIFADGTSNPWGVDFDRQGNAFVSACVIDHLFHMAPGGIYQRQGGIPENPYAYELLPSIVEHKHHMAAYCGICIYDGGQFPEEYRGRVFMGNIHQNALNHDKLTPNGSSFKATAEPDFLTTSDGWFRPISEQVGPDGALWIGDWYDRYPCYQNAQADPEGVDRERGRIWRVVYTGKNPGAKIPSRPTVNMDLSKLKNEELVALLENSNQWQRRTAQRLLTERSDRSLAMQSAHGLNLIVGISEGRVSLEKLVMKGKAMDARLAALWTLHGIGPMYGGEPGIHQDWSQMLEELLNDQDASMRSWAVRFIAEDLRMRARVLAAQPKDAASKLQSYYDQTFVALTKLAADPDPSVRLAVATAVRQVISSSLTVDTDINTGLPIGKILTALIQSSSDGKDPLIPFMTWMAGEPSMAQNPQPGLKWLAENGAATMPLSGVLARKTMRRICDTGEPAKVNHAVEFLLAVADKDDLVMAALDGLIEGQKAKSLHPTVATKDVLAKLNASSNPKVKERAQQLGTIWGDAGAVEKTLALVNDNKASVEERSKAIQGAKQLKNDAAREVLLKLVSTENSEVLVITGLQALSSVGGDNVAPELVKHWKRYSAAERRAVADVLVSRWPWTEVFLNAVQDKVIQPNEISASVIRTIANYKDTNFNSRMEQLLGKYRESSADKLQLIKDKRKAVVTGTPDIAHGHEVAKRTCFVCHKLHGEGADVGPDLTGVGRSTLEALLANVIDPNQIIGKGYELVEVELKDGRSVSGRLVEESDAQLKLIAAGPTENVVAKSDIESRRVSQLSVMPEGLEQMPEDDFRDLVWFILSPPQEGELTAEKRKLLLAK